MFSYLIVISIIFLFLVSIFLPARRFKRLNSIAERLKKREKIVLKSQDKFINLFDLMETTINNFEKSTRRINIRDDLFNITYNVPSISTKIEVAGLFKNTSVYYRVGSKVIGPFVSNTELVSLDILEIKPYDYEIKRLVKKVKPSTIRVNGRNSVINKFNSIHTMELEKL